MENKITKYSLGNCLKGVRKGSQGVLFRGIWLVEKFLFLLLLFQKGA